MNDERSERLSALLRGAAIPASPSARHQAAAAAGEAIVDRGDLRRRMLALALVALASVSFVALTPPGRALAEWAAGVVGVGEVGGPPTLNEIPRNPPVSKPPIVFAKGTAPNGKPFEMVAYETRGLDAGGSISNTELNPATCFRVEFPDGAGSLRPVEGWCYSGSPTERGISVYSTSLGEQDSDGDSIVTLQGEANADTRSVEVTYTDTRSGERREVQATVAVLDGELGKRIGVRTPTAAFVAFVPGLDHVSPLWVTDYATEAVAYDGNGTEIARDKANPFEGRDATIELLRRDVARIRGAMMQEHCAGLDLESMPDQEIPPDCQRALELGREFRLGTVEVPPPVYRGAEPQP